MSTDFLFFAYSAIASNKSSHLNYYAYCKPLCFDDLFWKIVKLEENSKQPLSFRATGVWTAPMMTLASGFVPLSGHTVPELEAGMDEIFVRCAPEIELAMKRAPNLDGYLQLVEESHARLLEEFPDAKKNVWVERLLTAILTENYSLAREIIEQRKRASDEGGFISGPGWRTFYDMAAEYLDQIN